MTEFPSNSHAAKKAASVPEKKVEAVTSTPAVRRKRPLGRRIKEFFVGEDNKSVMEFVWFDIVLPGVRNTIVDAGQTALERKFLGHERTVSRRAAHRGAPGYTPYNRYSAHPAASPPPRERLSRQARAMHNFDEILLMSRHEAQEVLDRMFDIIQRYEQTTVEDLYELCGLESDFTDTKYGWTDLSEAGIERVREGYLLRLPRPELLA